MGIRYEIINTKNKTTFDLDKGPWTTNIHNYTSREKLMTMLERWLDDKPYIIKVIKKIEDFMSNADVEDFVIISDSDNCTRDIYGGDELKEVGSRFSS